MRAEWFEFRPQFKLFFATNHKPIIRGTDLAIWRRIRLIPFNVTIPEDEVDPDLGQKLLQELPGILNWAIEGCLVWQKEGLGLPAEVAEATEAYRNEMDVLGDFFDECCILNPLARVTKRDFYEAYVQWAERSRETVLSQRKIGMMMMERGFTEVRLGAKSERYWQGVGLADTTDITDTNSIIRQRQGPSREKRNDVSDVSDVSASGTRVTRLPL
jgi:putative DNA primase/helicase